MMYIHLEQHHTFFLKSIRDWYSTGEKVWPRKRLTSTELKMLYISDGSKRDDNRDNGRPTITISINNESNNREKVEEMFLNFDVDVRWSNDQIYFTVDDSETLWNYMGSSPPGFQYKWPDGKNVKDRLMHEL